MKMKVFSNSDPEALETLVNAWLESNLGSSDVQHITVAPTPMPYNPNGDQFRPIIVVTIWYLPP
jgi:hypothetical protein